MAITNGYATAVQFNARYLPGQTAATLAALDMQIEQTISAACRLIDDYTGRVFYSTTSSGRYFTATSSCRCYVDDFQSVTTLKIDDDYDGVYETTIAAADYWKMPAAAQNGQPYTYLEIKPWADESFPYRSPMAVELTAVWGWAAVPDAIREACLLQAFRMYKDQAAPYGVVGGGELGTMTAIAAGKLTGLDPRVEAMIKPYMRVRP